MVGRSYNKDSSRVRDGRGSGRGELEGFAPFSRGRGNPPIRGGFAALSSGRGENMVLPPGFMAMLRAHNIPGYYPTMPNQEWLQHQQQTQNCRDPAYYPRLDNIPSTSTSVHPDYELRDEGEEEDDAIEVEGAAEEGDIAEEGNNANKTSTLSNTGSTAVSTGSSKELAYIRPGTLDVIEPSRPCARRITKTFEDTLHKECLTWGSLPLDKKNNYFEEFRKHFTLTESDEDGIRCAWEKKAKLQYAAMLSRIHKSKKQPKFVLDAVWQLWTEKWKHPDFKRQSETMKSNRGRASTHTGGSRSFLNTADLLKKQLKNDILPHELFGYNHSKGHDLTTFVSSKAMAVNEAYKREIEAQTMANTENGTPINEVEAYLKAAGRINKSHVYGIGGQKKILYGSSSSSSSSQKSSGRSHQNEIEQLREELRMEKEGRIRNNEKMEAMQRQLDNMQTMFQKLVNPTVEFAPRDQETGSDNLGLNDLD